jgi:hypothetical protein
MATPDEELINLNDDGVSEDLFVLLRSKDELNFGPCINIPDTVIFKYGQVTNWYFTASDGRIKRKNKHNLFNARVEESFNKNILGYDVVASFISIPLDKDNQSSQATVEFLDRSDLNDFLYSSKKEKNGILQRFVEPKSNKNEIIRAIWSPKLCLVERAENKHLLHDRRYGLYERCVTVEGPEFYRYQLLVSGAITIDLPSFVLLYSSLFERFLVCRHHFVVPY